MRLLLDQNLSPYLVDRLEDAFPGSIHVSEVGLDRSVDQELWEYAQEEGLAIVTKDADFSELSTLYGPPPVVIWIRRGNCSSKDIERVLRRHQDALEEMAAESPVGIVELY